MPLAISSMRVPDWLFVIMSGLPVCSLESARECREVASRYNAGLQPAESARHGAEHRGSEADVERDHPNDCAVELGVEFRFEGGEFGVELGFEAAELGVEAAELGIEAAELGIELGVEGIDPRIHAVA